MTKETPEAELARLRVEESERAAEAESIPEFLPSAEEWGEPEPNPDYKPYTPRNFEILEGVVREVLPDEGVEFWNDPTAATPALQRKYIGIALEDYEEPQDIPEDEIPSEGFEVYDQAVTNPFTGESKTIRSIRPLPAPPSNQEIGDKIQAEVFGGNPYAQLADMTKAQVITLALLCPIIGKENILKAYSGLIETVRKVSDARVANGLEPFDLSFLD